MALPHPNLSWLEGGERPTGTVTNGVPDGNINRPLNELLQNDAELQSQIDTLAAAGAQFPPHNLTSGIQGGVSGATPEHFHFSEAQHIAHTTGVDASVHHNHDGRYYTQAQVDAAIAAGGGFVEARQTIQVFDFSNPGSDLPSKAAPAGSWFRLDRSGFGIDNGRVLLVYLDAWAAFSDGGNGIIWVHHSSNTTDWDANDLDQYAVNNNIWQTTPYIANAPLSSTYSGQFYGTINRTPLPLMGLLVSGGTERYIHFRMSTEGAAGSTAPRLILNVLGYL